MRPISAAAAAAGLALACAVLAGPATAARPSARPAGAAAAEAADQTLGMALMSASVDTGGVVLHASGIASVTPLQTGVAEVVFERGLNGCDVVASAMNANSSSAYGVYTVTARRWSPTSILVQTYSAGVLTNRPFAVIAFCAG